jgi:hypothetical protein
MFSFCANVWHCRAQKSNPRSPLQEMQHQRLTCHLALQKGFRFFNLLQIQIQKGQKFLKPCYRTTQFSAGLHCQSESSAGQSSLGGV